MGVIDFTSWILSTDVMDSISSMFFIGVIDFTSSILFIGSMDATLLLRAASIFSFKVLYSSNSF